MSYIHVKLGVTLTSEAKTFYDSQGLQLFKIKSISPSSAVQLDTADVPKIIRLKADKCCPCDVLFYLHLHAETYPIEYMIYYLNPEDNQPVNVSTFLVNNLDVGVLALGVSKCEKYVDKRVTEAISQATTLKVLTRTVDCMKYLTPTTGDNVKVVPVAYNLTNPPKFDASLVDNNNGTSTLTILAQTVTVDNVDYEFNHSFSHFKVYGATRCQEKVFLEFKFTPSSFEIVNGCPDYSYTIVVT